MNALRLIVLFVVFPLLLVAGGAWEIHRIETELAKNAEFEARLPNDLAYVRSLVAQNPNQSVKFGEKTITAQRALTRLENAQDEMGFTHGVDRARQVLAPGVMFFGLLTALLGLGAIAWVQRAAKRAQLSQVMLISTWLEGRQLLPRLLVGHTVSFAATVTLMLAYECLALWKQGEMSGFEIKLALGAWVGAAFCLYGVWLMLKQSKTLLSLFEPSAQQMFGQLVRPDQAPGLWHQVEHWAAKLGALPPDHIVVSLSAGFHITAGETWLYPEKLVLPGRTLHVPLCDLALLSQEEVGAVVGHELAHFVGAKAEFNQRFLPLYDGARRKLEAVESNIQAVGGNLQANAAFKAMLLLPAMAFGNYFLDKLEPAAFAQDRERQLEADAAAATLAGNTVLASALLRMAVLGPQVKELMEVYRDLNKSNWPMVEDIAWQTLAELQHRELKLSNLALATSLPHPTHRLPATSERLQALGVPVQAVLASATRSTSTPVASAALDSWFTDALALCRQLSSERVTESVNQETQYIEELEAHAGAVEGEVYLHEGARFRGILTIGIALPCLALVMFLTMLRSLSPEGFAEDQALAFGIVIVLLVLALVWGARLIKRSPLTALLLTPDHVAFNNLVKPVPLLHIENVQVVENAGTYLVVRLTPDAPWPAARATGFGIPNVWRQKWRRALTLRTEYLCINDERLSGDELVGLFVDYINAARAREQLQQQAPRVSGMATKRGFTV